jgi:hypothetical protein
MTEIHPAYVPCASGCQAQTDCLVQRFGDLVQIAGHSEMTFTCGDGRELARQIWRTCEAIDGEILALRETPPSTRVEATDILEGFSDGLYRVQGLKNGGWRITRVDDAV